MFAISPATRVFLLAGATDMRRGFNGLYSLAAHRIKEDPRSGHLFVFCNRQRNRLKILWWDGSGLWVCAKRLERGRFSWPEDNQSPVVFNGGELTLLLNGIELKDTKKKRWYRIE